MVFGVYAIRDVAHRVMTFHMEKQLWVWVGPMWAAATLEGAALGSLVTMRSSAHALLATSYTSWVVGSDSPECVYGHA